MSTAKETAMSMLQMVVEDAKLKGATDLEVMQRVLLALQKGEQNDFKIKLENVQTTVNPEKTLEEDVAQTILQLGIPAYVKGYKYLREAIIMAIKNPLAMEAVTKGLYASIAAKFNATASVVEKSIRSAIELGWDRGNMDLLQEYFGHNPNIKGKVRNSEFIAIVADKVSLQRKQLQT